MNPTDLEVENRRLQRLLDLQERDRQLVAFEIHDGLAQHLAGALLFLETARNEESLSARAAESLDTAIKLLRDALSEARRLMSSQRPAELAEKGIVAAVELLVEETRVTSQLEIEFRHDVNFDRLAPALETAIYRVIQEGLRNARRHSQSPRALVTLTQRGERVEIEIRDWGLGFDPAHDKPGHFGLAGIRERARLFGGSAEITSAPGQGTRVFVELPLTDAVIDNASGKEPV